ncbi:MAG: hypothetical protein WD357_00550, partial [Gracilimonas sp.]
IPVSIDRNVSLNFNRTTVQFYNGLDETKGNNNVAFWNFFKNSIPFKSHFSKEKAFTFYSHFRCGILHQVQTKKKSVLRIGRSEMVKNIDEKISEGLIIDRVKFHNALEEEINLYKNKLLNDDVILKQNFITKMNLICDI